MLLLSSNICLPQELANGGTLLSELRDGWLQDQATGALNMTLLLQVGTVHNTDVHEYTQVMSISTQWGSTD
jgi:hypothetical protein